MYKFEESTRVEDLLFAYGGDKPKAGGRQVAGTNNFDRIFSIINLTEFFPYLLTIYSVVHNASQKSSIYRSLRLACEMFQSLCWLS